MKSHTTVRIPFILKLHRGVLWKRHDRLQLELLRGPTLDSVALQVNEIQWKGKVFDEVILLHPRRPLHGLLLCKGFASHLRGDTASPRAIPRFQHQLRGIVRP